MSIYVKKDYLQSSIIVATDKSFEIAAHINIREGGGVSIIVNGKGKWIFYYDMCIVRIFWPMATCLLGISKFMFA